MQFNTADPDRFFASLFCRYPPNVMFQSIFLVSASFKTNIKNIIMLVKPDENLAVIPTLINQKV